MRHRGIRAAIGAVAALSMVLLTAGIASAQAPGTTGAASGSYRGEIVVSGEAPRVNVNGEERPLVVAPGATIQRGNVAVKTADLKKGDVITVTTNPDGSAARIEAVPADENGSGFKWWYLAPLLLLPLLFLFFRRNKKEDSFVVERTTESTPVRTTTTTDRTSTTNPR